MAAQLRQRVRGIGLIEILVGMAIGLVVVLIIAQVISTYEGLKRNTSSGAGAQEAGYFGLTTIERDVRAAGWGIPTADIMACSAYYTYFSDGTTTGAVPNFPSMPVRITDGGTGAGASDSITMLWGTSVRSNVRNMLLQNVVANPPGTSAAALYPTTAVGLSSVGGFVWLTDDANNCTLVQITASAANVASPGTVILTHAAGTGTASAPTYNPPTAYMTSSGWPTNYNNNPRIFDVGALTQRTYSVAGTTNKVLRSQDYFSSTTQVDLGNNIVAMKAQYGIADAGSQVVNNWVSAVNDGTTNWASPSITLSKRIKAVRIALVARSTQKQDKAVVAADCTTTASAPVTWPGGPTVDLSDDAFWKCYRYRVFETIIPLRNVLWANLS